jgi:hypothetical protein
MSDVIPLLDGKATATRVTKARDMLRMDRDHLASVSPQQHSRRLGGVRVGAIEIWRIDGTDPDDWVGLLWVVEIDTEDDEVRYLGDVTLHSSARDRAALLEFLVLREAVPGCWHTRDQFARLALSPALVNAVQRGACETMQVRFNDTLWTFTLGWCGVLAAVAGPDDRLGGWPIH